MKLKTSLAGSGKLSWTLTFRGRAATPESLEGGR